MKCDNANIGCAWVGTVGALDKHLAKCEYCLVPCKYEGLGCEAVFLRKEKFAHEEDDKLHLHMAIDTITRLNEEKSKIVLKEGEFMTFEMPDYETRKRQEASTFYSPSFYIGSKGYHVRIAVLFSGYEEGRETDMWTYMYLQALEGDNDDKLSWPFEGRVNFSLLNQLENANHYHGAMCITAEHELLIDAEPKGTDFFHHSVLRHDPVKNIQYLKDDTLYFRVSVEPVNHKSWLECTADKK